MISVSNKFRECTRDNNRITNAKIEVSQDEDWIVFTTSQIVKFTIDQSITNGDDFAIGNVIFSKFQLELYTDIILENNATVRPYIQVGVEEDKSEWLQLGVYKIDTRKKQDKLWVFECFDELITSQKMYESNLRYPTTTKLILQEILSNMGYEIDQAYLDSLVSFTVTNRIEPNTYTYQDVLGFLAQIYSSNLIMDNEGKLKFVSVTDREVKETIRASEYGGLKQINETKTITQVVANMGGDRKQISEGTGKIDNTLFLENPIISTTMVRSIYNNILGYKFEPLEISNWRTFPYIEAGDFIEFELTDGSTLKTVVQTNVITYTGGLSGNIKSPAKSYSQTEYGFKGETSQRLSGMQGRIGSYALGENKDQEVVRNRFSGHILLQFTTTDDTDLEFTIKLTGVSTNNTILHAEVRGNNGKIGNTLKTRIFEGFNTVSISFLAKSVPQTADNLLLFLKTDSGEFVIEPLDGQFYIYGANLIGGESGIPYANVDETAETPEVTENLEIIFDSPRRVNVDDTAAEMQDVTNVADVMIIEGEEK